MRGPHIIYQGEGADMGHDDIKTLTSLRVDPAPPSGALVIPFPMHRNIGKVRHTAKLALSKGTRRDREAYWSMVCSRLISSMGKAGLDEDQIFEQLEDFRQAVSTEMDRLQEGRTDAREGRE
jgi:hypothetical protein